VDSRSLDEEDYDEEDYVEGNYSLPARSRNTYKFKNGPRGRQQSNKYVVAATRKDNKRSPVTIRA